MARELSGNLSTCIQLILFCSYINSYILVIPDISTLLLTRLAVRGNKAGYTVPGSFPSTATEYSWHCLQDNQKLSSLTAMIRGSTVQNATLYRLSLSPVPKSVTTWLLSKS